MRIMTNLLTFSERKLRRESESKPLDGIPASYSLVPLRRSIVFIMGNAHMAMSDRSIAAEYVFEYGSVADVCAKNAIVARQHGRYDHERTFKILQALFPNRSFINGRGCPAGLNANSLSHQIITGLFVCTSFDSHLPNQSFRYSQFSIIGDLQMLAMTSMIILQACCTSAHTLSPVRVTAPKPEIRNTSSVVQNLGADYFSVTGVPNDSSPLDSPSWPRLPSASPIAPSMSSSTSSKGSWSSLFNTGSVRQFMSSVQDSIKDGAMLPTDSQPGPVILSNGPTPVSGDDQPRYKPESPRRRRVSSIPAVSPVSRSSSELAPSAASKAAVTFSSTDHVPRSSFSQVVSPKHTIPEKRVLNFDKPKQHQK
jgi:hypothetical protein